MGGLSASDSKDKEVFLETKWSKKHPIIKEWDKIDKLCQRKPYRDCVPVLALVPTSLGRLFFLVKDRNLPQLIAYHNYWENNLREVSKKRVRVPLQRALIQYMRRVRFAVTTVWAKAHHLSEWETGKRPAVAISVKRRPGMWVLLEVQDVMHFARSYIKREEKVPEHTFKPIAKGTRRKRHEDSI